MFKFILESITCDELTVKITQESEKREKRKEKILKWGDTIDMSSALAPSIGSRVL